MDCNIGYFSIFVALFGVFSLPIPTLGARPQCTPGHFLNRTSDECDPCPENTFAGRYNREDRCAECSRCTGMRKIEAACNATSDTKCSCPAGYYGHVDGCTLRRPKPSPTDTSDDATRRRLEAKLDNVSDILRSLKLSMSNLRQMEASPEVYNSMGFIIAILSVTSLILVIVIIFITRKAVKFCRQPASQRVSNRGHNARVVTVPSSSDVQLTTPTNNEQNELTGENSEVLPLMPQHSEQPSASSVSQYATTNSHNEALRKQLTTNLSEPSTNVAPELLQPQRAQPPASPANLEATTEPRPSTPSDGVSEHGEEVTGPSQSNHEQLPASSVNTEATAEGTVDSLRPVQHQMATIVDTLRTQRSSSEVMEEVDRQKERAFIANISQNK